MNRWTASAICGAAWVSFAASVEAFTVTGEKPHTVDLGAQTVGGPEKRDLIFDN